MSNDKNYSLLVADPLTGEVYFWDAVKDKYGGIKSLRLLTPINQQPDKSELEKCWEAHKQAMEWANREKAEKEKLAKKLEEVSKELSETKILLENSQQKLREEKANVRELAKSVAEYQSLNRVANRKIDKLESKLEEITKEKNDHWRRYKAAREEIVELKKAVAIDDWKLIELVRYTLRRLVISFFKWIGYGRKRS